MIAISMNAKKKCLICGEEFTTKPYRFSEAKYCSSVCYGESIRKHPRGSLTILMRKYKKAWKERNKEKVRIAERRRQKIKARKKGILPHISKEEISIYQDLLKIYKPEQILRNYRGVIKNPYTNYPLELDFFIPSENRAIEVNGACHRKITRGGQEKFEERQRNDLVKKQECERLGIKLEIINV